MAKTSLFALVGLTLLVAPAGPGRAAGLVDPVSATPALSAGLMPAADAKAAPALVPFEQSLSAYTLSGEDAEAVFTFRLDGEQAAAGGLLALAYTNAVSVLPDTARMDVEVNGRPAGGFAVASPGGTRTEEIRVDAALLKPGRNVVRLRARQHHRVDCSFDATYELWTRLDPAQSGFRPARAAAFSDFDALLAVRRGTDARTDIRLVLPGGVDAAALNEAAPALQALALFLDRDDLVVSVADRPGAGPGIDLVMAMDRHAAALAGLDLAGAPRGLSVRPAADGGRASVVLRAADRGEVNAAVLAAVRGPMADGLKSGVLAPGGGTLVMDAGERRLLKEAGYRSRVFSGRLSRTGFAVEMPADFYPADYATLDLHLHAATSPGLEPGAQLLVRVNDRIVKSYPFRNAEGEQFDGKRIELPLRAFRPGVNRVELLAELPVAADAACRPEARDDERPRFVLLDNTAVEVPALARIGRLPDLAALAGKAYPYRDGKPFDLFLDRADPQSAAAGLTLLSRLALSARAPLDATIVLGAPLEGTGRDALVIAAGEDFAEQGTAAKGAFPGAKADPLVTASVSDNADSAALLEAFRTATAAGEEELSPLARARLWLTAAAGRFGHWLSYGGETPARAAATEDGALVTLSQSRSPDGLATWTTVRAEAPGALEAGTRRLVEPAVWRDLEGGTVTIEKAGLTLETAPAAERYVAALADRSPGNLRRLAAAWFSDHFRIYVLLVLACLGLFAAWVGLAVSNKGVESKR